MSQIELDFSTWPSSDGNGYTAAGNGVVTLTTAGTLENPQVYKITGLPDALTSTTQYIVIGAEHITLDGNSKTVTVTANNYRGFVQNGKYVNGSYDDATKTYTLNNDIPAHGGCTIKNLSVDVTGGTLDNIGGWVCQQYFGLGNTGADITVENCYSSGAISGDNAGGIFGSYANSFSSRTIKFENCYSSGAIEGEYAGGIFGKYANRSSSGTITVENCNSSGEISGRYAGGIFGYAANYDSKTGSEITVTNCYSSGAIEGRDAGGFFGYQANYKSSGTITVTNCYSSGNISDAADNAGGIFGRAANSTSKTGSEITVTNCYSIGSIIGNHAGGFFGRYANNGSLGTITVTNCYSTGEISGINAGGIFGSYANLGSGTITVENCYSSGAISGQFAGGIFGYNHFKATDSGCYVARGTWSDSDAVKAGLFEQYNGSDVFQNPEGDVPWKLSSFTEAPWCEYIAYNSQPFVSVISITSMYQQQEKMWNTHIQ